MTSFRQLSAGKGSGSLPLCPVLFLSLSVCPLTTQFRFYEEPPPFTPKASTLLCTYVPPKEREREKKGEQFQFNACCSSFASRRRSRLSGKLILIPPSPRRGAKSPSLPRRSSADPIAGGASDGGASGGRGEEWRGEETAIW